MFTSIHPVRAELLLAEQTGGVMPSSLDEGSWYAAADDALLAFVFYRSHDARWLLAVLASDDARRYRLAHGESGFNSFAAAKAALDDLSETELLVQ